jgi:hypothetical protein
MINKKKKPIKGKKEKEEELIPFSALGLDDGSSISPKENLFDRMERVMNDLSKNCHSGGKEEFRYFSRIKRDKNDIIMRILATSTEAIAIMNILPSNRSSIDKVQTMFHTLRLLEKCGIISINKDIYNEEDES